MAEQVGSIYYDVDANLEPLLGKMRQAESSMGDLNAPNKKLQQEFDKTSRSANALGGELNSLTRVIKGVFAAMALREAAGMVQAYQTMSERVKMATDSTEEFEYVQKRLQDTADGTYRSLSEAQELYIRTADSLKAMGYTTQELVDIQDSMSYAFVTNATSADRAQAAISQFTKSINTGKVSADQWETITSALPSVINDIADASGKSASEVRALGAAGKLAARDLTEGLRASLEQNRSSAEGMATDLIDASVRIKNAVTVTLAAIEEQTGAIQAVTNGIIMASEAMLEFGSDSESMATLLNLGTTAAASFAAVVAGRLLMSMKASAAAMYDGTIAARAKAAADLQAAQAGAKLAAEQLIQAQAAVRAAGGKMMSSGAASQLAAAETAATAATARLTAAQRVMAASFSVSATAARGLQATMAFLGGPAGVVMLAAVAVYSFATSAKKATKPTDELTASISDLGNEMREVRKIDIGDKIAELDRLAVQMQRNIDFTEKYIADNARLADNKKLLDGLQRERGKLEENRKEVGLLQKALEELSKTRTKTDKDGGNGGGGSTELSEFQKLEQSLKNQIELAKRTGLARAELSALQRLGAAATDEERQRISELAAELYRLEEQTKAAEKAESDRQKAAEEALKGNQANVDAIAALREQLYQTTLNADELVQRQAELSLNKYATPEQIAEIRAVASELRAAQEEAAELERRRNAFGRDPAQEIRGKTDPLSGGAFDDQYARYAAEEAAEEERYAAQLDRLREAKELQIEVVGGYQALEEQMAQEHADRMAQIEQAKMQTLLASGEAGFGALTDIMKNAFGEQSSAYKAAFAAQKVFSIAQSLLAIKTGVAMAAANPWPQNLAAMASVAAATAGLVSDVQSITMGGGRMAGGPVNPSSMYRINEGGRPEVFTAANGHQYMLPNTRGEVVSNRDASKGGNVIVNIHNAPPGTRAEQSDGMNREQIINVWIADFQGDGPTKDIIQNKFALSPQGR